MKANCEVLERKLGSISNAVFEGTFEACQNWMKENTIILKNRGIFTDLTDLDCQTKDEFDLKIEIRISSDSNVRNDQIKKNGSISTYSIVKES